MDEINGRLLATQLLITGLIARVANQSRDPVGFLTDFRDEIHAVAAQIRINGVEHDLPVRVKAREVLDELFGLMKPPSNPEETVS